MGMELYAEVQQFNGLGIILLNISYGGYSYISLRVAGRERDNLLKVGLGQV